jgi:hypothetical protein
MTSNLNEAYQILNKGIYIKHNYTSISNYNRVLKLLGLHTKEICYLCSNESKYKYNDYELCHPCFDHVQQYYNDSTTIFYNNNKMRKYGGIWISDTNSFHVVKHKYETEVPTIILQILYLGKFVYTNDICVNCDNYMWSDEMNIHGYGDYCLCDNCYDEGLLYFDLTVTFYVQLKQLFIPDIAQYIVLCYYKYKLANVCIPKNI